MLVWARGGVVTVESFDGTLGGLIRSYQNDKVSPYNKLRHQTRVQYNNGVVYPVITPTNAAGGGTFIRWTPILVPASANDLRTDSAFVNDTWNATSRLTFTSGWTRASWHRAARAPARRRPGQPPGGPSRW